MHTHRHTPIWNTPHTHAHTRTRPTRTRTGNSRQLPDRARAFHDRLRIRPNAGLPPSFDRCLPSSLALAAFTTGGSKALVAGLTSPRHFRLDSWSEKKTCCFLSFLLFFPFQIEKEKGAASPHPPLILRGHPARWWGQEASTGTSVTVLELFLQYFCAFLIFICKTLIRPRQRIIMAGERRVLVFQWYLWSPVPRNNQFPFLYIHLDDIYGHLCPAIIDCRGYTFIWEIFMITSSLNQSIAVFIHSSERHLCIDIYGSTYIWSFVTGTNRLHCLLVHLNDIYGHQCPVIIDYCVYTFIWEISMVSSVNLH